jgi:hypothetical protein
MSARAGDCAGAEQARRDKPVQLAPIDESRGRTTALRSVGVKKDGVVDERGVHLALDGSAQRLAAVGERPGIVGESLRDDRLDRLAEIDGEVEAGGGHGGAQSRS